MRREFPRKVKAAVIARAAGHCERCKAALKPREGEVDHILPDVLGGDPVASNAMLLCRVCHVAKSAQDIRRTRKADRQRDKATGAVKPAGKIKSPGFPKREKPARESKASLPRINIFTQEPIR